MSYSVEIVPYNPLWPSLFQEEALAIQEILGENCLKIHHIGSTSVPGLSAKPIIDMMPVVKDILKVDSKKFEELGYISRGELGMAFRRFFTKGENPRTHHVHIWEEGNPQIEKHLLFKVYLIQNPSEAKRYENLKYQLAQQHAQDRNQYTLGKVDLIDEMIQKTGYQGLSMVQALTDREWEVYQRLSGENINSQTTNHYRFVLYKGVDIIGALHVEMMPGVPGKISGIFLDPQYIPLFEDLSNLGSRWISHQMSRS